MTGEQRKRRRRDLVSPRGPQCRSRAANRLDRSLSLENLRCITTLVLVLRLKLQQRRTREEFVNQGIMPALKSSAAFHEQRQSLERAQTEDYLKRKFPNRPERPELIRMHILAETSAEASLQAKQLQRKRARFADDLNKTQFPKALCDNLSCDKDNNDSICPERSGSQPLGLGPLSFPPDTLTRGTIPSATQVSSLPPHLIPLLGSFPSLKLSRTEGSTQKVGASSQMKPKPNTDRSAQRHKKPIDNGPKIKKLKYHQYVPPDQKGDKEPPPHLDSSYSEILQQQQLFLQLQILSQQQQNYSCHPILPIPSRPQKNQLDEMKVADLKSELKLRSLPVYGTKNDLIERLRTYEELSGGSDTTSSPTAGGSAGPGAERAADASSSAAHQLITCSGTVSLPSISVLPSDNLPAAKSPQDTSVNRSPLGKILSFKPRLATQLPADIKEEPMCSDTAPCQFCLKPACLQKHCPVLSTAHTTTTTAPVLTVDKDKMLQEKDKQIEELTRMLRQKQKLVEALKMQLEQGKRGRQVPDPVVFVRVKQERPDKPRVALSCGHPPFSPSLSSVSGKMDVTKVTVKQEATEAEEVVSETTLQSPDTHESSQLLSQEVQEQIVLQIKRQHTNTSAKTKEQQHSCLQQTTLHLAQQQAIEKLLLQQRKVQSQQTTFQTLANQQNLQKCSQQRKRKAHKQQKQQQSQQQHEQPKQHLQLKQQILLKQQMSPLKQKIKQQQLTKKTKQINLRINLKQQQVLIQKNSQVQQQLPQVSQVNLKKQPAPLDLLKRDSAPTLVTDNNGNRFLIALTSHVTEKQRTNAPEATNEISLLQVQRTSAKLPHQHKAQNTKAQNGGLYVSVDQRQGAAQCVSAPHSVKPLFKDQEPVPSRKNSISLSSQSEVSSRLDVLLSPLSPASIEMAASSPDKKDTEGEDDFVDMILQTGEMQTMLQPAPDLCLDCLYPNSPGSPPPLSSLQLLQSPPIPPSCDTTHQGLIEQSEPESLVDPTEDKQQSSSGSGRLEDFLESTTGTPLLGVEPGGLLALIDDLHSQMLCTPSILEHPPSPMDSFDTVAEVQQGLNINDWLELTMGGETDEETPTQVPLGPQTPCGIFSTDCLDSCMIL